MKQQLGGKLDWRGMALLAGAITDEEYRARAERHRPPITGIHAEALRLLATGLSARDVAQALRVAEDLVVSWARAAA